MTSSLSHRRFRRERDPLWRREMRERWRRPITLFFLALYCAGLCWLAYSLYASLVPVGAVNDMATASGAGHRLFTSLLVAQILGWIPLALLLAAPTIAVERERRAFTEYLLAGLSAQQIARAKAASIASFIVVMCAVPLPVLALCFPLGGVEPLEFFAGALLEMAVALVCAAMGLWISAQHARVTVAMQASVAVSLGFLLFAVPVSSDLLNAPPLIWLTIAAGLLFVAGVLLVACESSLDDIARHIERYERQLETPRLPSPSLVAAPPVQPKPQFVPASPARPALSANSLSANAFEPPFPPRFEPPKLKSLDEWLEKIAGKNAVAQREVRVGTRAALVRQSSFIDPYSELSAIWCWVIIGAVGALLVSFSGEVLWQLALFVVLIGAAGAAALGASAAFTREREQKMLEQLRLCSLSPLEIVAGKLAATLFLTARNWGAPLFALCLMSAARGVPLTVASAVFIVASAAFAAMLGIFLSLVCRHASIAAGGSVAALTVMFVVLPSASGGLLFFVPVLRPLLNSFWLSALWLEPLRVVWHPLPFQSQAVSLWILAGTLALWSALLLGAATALLKRAKLDESQTPFWERDLSKSWR